MPSSHLPPGLAQTSPPPFFSNRLCPTLCLRRLKFADVSMTPCALEHIGDRQVENGVVFPALPTGHCLSGSYSSLLNHISSAGSVFFPSSSSHWVLLTLFPFFVSLVPGEKQLSLCNWCLGILLFLTLPLYLWVGSLLLSPINLF